MTDIHSDGVNTVGQVDGQALPSIGDGCPNNSIMPHTQLPEELTVALAAGDAQATTYRSIVSSDPDSHAESLRDWQQTYDQLTAGRFHGRLTELWLGDIQLFRETTNQSVVQRGRAWSGAGVFGIPLSMNTGGYFCEQPLDSQNSILSFGHQDEFELRTPRVFDLIGIAINADCYNAISDLALSSEQDTLVDLTNRPAILPGTPELDQLRTLLIEVFQTLDHVPERLQSPQVQKTLRSAIVGHLLAAIRQPANSTTASLPGPSMRKRILEQARLHVLTNLHEPVTIGDICQKIGVSRRTLQYCFQEIMGTNPVQYLRAVRLNNVRRELRAASAGSIQIADIASRWGFWHLSHFATEYRDLFGELPSETLRRT